MSNQSRILYWCETRKHVFETDYVEQKNVGSLIGEDNLQENSTSTPANALSEQTANASASDSSESSAEKSLNTKSEPIELLIGRENDILIPSTEQINSVFFRGQNSWCAYVEHANHLPCGAVPAASLDAYSLLQDVPPLPQDLRKKHIIKGRALWKVPIPELSMNNSSYNGINKEPWNPEHVYGATKFFPLWIDKPPARCSISSRSDFHHCTNNKPPLADAPNGLAILTLMWAYILSARLLEMQGRHIQYSHTTLSPILFNDVRPLSGKISIYLGDVSRELVRWICALLVQGQGWLVRGPSPPWAAYYDGGSPFIIVTSREYSGLAIERPPSSAEATDLLIEFCRLYPFESQPTAAFLAALVLPLHRYSDLQPQLPMPRLTGYSDKQSAPLDRIQDYSNDLLYFMTLSISPFCLGSACWSIFWEPGVQCNLASAWLGSAHQAIKPLLDVVNMERLAKVFAFRCPQLAPLWLGIFLCGCTEIVDMIQSYLTTLQDQPWMRPDSDVAAWTRSPQSFFDEVISGPYRDNDALVPRADLLRHRFNYRLADTDDIVHYGWQPFGTVVKTDIEPELWPRLECKPTPRKYLGWTWWVGREASIIEKCFRNDRGCNRANSTSNDLETLNPLKAKSTLGFNCEVRLEPSKEATFRVFDWGSKSATGDRSIDAMMMPGILEHPWFEDFR